MARFPSASTFAIPNTGSLHFEFLDEDALVDFLKNLESKHECRVPGILRTDTCTQSNGFSGFESTNNGGGDLECCSK